MERNLNNALAIYDVNHNTESVGKDDFLILQDLKISVAVSETISHGWSIRVEKVDKDKKFIKNIF